MEVGILEVQRLQAVINHQLLKMKKKELPDIIFSDNPKAPEITMGIIKELLRECKAKMDQNKSRFVERQAETVNQNKKTRNHRCLSEKVIEEKRQILQMIETETSQIELQMREDAKLHQLKIKPLKQALAKQERREKLIKNQLRPRTQ